MEPDEIRVALEQLLDARVDDLRRLTGGASRETWSFTADGRRRVLQRERPGSPRAGTMPREAALIHAAGEVGVPVARVVASGADEAGLGTGFMVAEYVEGETIARRILRDDEYATARDVLAEQCGRALAGVHRVALDAVDGLERPDQLAQYREILDAYGDPIPAFELAFRWLEEHRPEVTGEAVVHGDFRLGNLMIGADGLRAVVDWELAHIGDPMEDLGWLCVRAWRFGGEHPVGGVGSYEQLFEAYAAAADVEVDPEIVRWWEVLGTLKWGIICIMQSRVHLDGTSRSVELAAIGRRVCENEHDLLLLLAPEALERATARAATPSVTDAGMFGRPTAAELVEAVREYLDGDVRETTSGATAFHGRVASNALAAVQRELEQGPGMVAENVARLGGLGIGNEADMADAIREGRFDDRVDEVQTVVAETVADKLRVANPGYFPAT